MRSGRTGIRPGSDPALTPAPSGSERDADAEPEDAVSHFVEQRQTNVDYLRDLPSDAGGRVALHREAGPITLNQMLHEWALHDLGHIRQIAELVRARKYLEGAGPLGSNYQLNRKRPVR